MNSTITSSRNHEVDGVRGWASLSVLFFHMFWEMLGKIHPEIRSPLTSIVLNGNYAVWVFFVLSGDALSVAFYSKGTTAIDSLVLKRYFRLTIPVFVSCLGVYLLIHSGLDFHSAAAPIVDREDWLGEFIKINPSIYNLFEYSFYGVYAHHDKSISFNPLLWTMKIEIIGSMIVFLLAYVWIRLRRPTYFLLAMGAVLFLLNSDYFLFISGMFLGGLRKNGFFEKIKTTKLSKIPIFLIFAVGISMPAIFYGHYIFNPVSRLICVLIVFSIYSSDFLCGFFSSRLSIYLGKISFPLYLIHFWVIISLMSYLIINIASVQTSLAIAVGIALTSVIVSLLIAHVFSMLEISLLKRIDFLIKKKVMRDA